MDVITIATPSLGNRSHLVTDGDVAAVIDPQRDIDRMLAEVAQRDLRVTHVLETHVHNDYVSGGLELADRTGATYHVAADDPVEFDRAPVHDGDVIEVGGFTLRAVHTPGHTRTHLSYVADDGEQEVAVFTGGSMLYGSVGRTDLVDDELTEELTRHQYRSVRRLATDLDEATQVHPTHGFGSFCSSGDTSDRDNSTIGHEQRDNDALTTDDEDEFVARLVAGQDAYPSYYAHMAPRNLSGPAPVDLSPAEVVDVAALKRRVHAGQWIVDLRDRRAFAEAHLHGTVNVELADAASTYLAWLLPWGTPVTLLADTAGKITQMQRQLVRIGIDQPAGQYAEGLPAVADDDRGSYRVEDFAALRAMADDGGEPWVLDARQDLEWADGHVPGAHHVPLHEVPDRLDEVPADRPVWVHCGSGYRASIASSLLARAGRTPVLVDDVFDEHAPEHFDLTTD